MSEEVFAGDNESIIDRMFGEEKTETPHSRTEEKLDATNDPAPAPEAEKSLETFDPYDDGSDEDFADDSAEEKAEKEDVKADKEAPAPADSAEEKEAQAPQRTAEDYEQEIAKLNKRLHDTQKAYHERSEKASSLEKRIAELENKKSDTNEEDDNWFSEDDKKEVASLKQELSEIKKENEAFGEQQQEIQQQANLAAWHQAAASVREKHADFDELVYDKLEPMLDEEKGDPRIRALYLQQMDKTPEGAYKFAKNLSLLLELLDNPEGFEARVANNATKKENATPEPPRTVQGKEALRNLPSADYAEENTFRTDSLVDKFFS
jgi:chromosome segregation ATPase